VTSESSQNEVWLSVIQAFRNKNDCKDPKALKRARKKKKKKNTNTQNTSFQKDAIYKRDSPLQYFNNKNPANFKISGF